MPATAIINALIVLPTEAGGPRFTTLRFNQKQILSTDVAPQRGDVVLDLPNRTVYPGLINAHDHLELNHYPRTKFRDVYDNAHQWGEEFLPKLNEEPFVSLRKIPLDEQCQIGIRKNLASGVTTVAHHNPLHPTLRQNYSVRVVQRYGWAHSLHFEKHVKQRYRKTPRNAPFMIHLAEGTDDVARKELKQLDDVDCLQANTVAIHGVGLSESDQVRMLSVGAGLVWCPSSNLFLLGQTADVRRFARAGKLALGTDSKLTADGDILDELRAAYATGQLTPEQLFRTVTIDAATLLRLERVGALLPGYAADLFITFYKHDPYLALLSLHPARIELIFVNGTVICLPKINAIVGGTMNSSPTRENERMNNVSDSEHVEQPDISKLPQTRPLTDNPAQTPEQDNGQKPQTSPLPNTSVSIQPPEQQAPTTNSSQPEAQPQQKAPETEQTKSAPMDPAQWQVMIIDDEPDNVGVAKLILEFNKSIVRSADSGSSGLEMLREKLPTFLLLDIQMPKMSGWDVLKVIRDDPKMKELPVIALTAHAMVGDKERILAGGFDGYISKPVSPLTFIDLIKDVLGSRPNP